MSRLPWLVIAMVAAPLAAAVALVLVLNATLGDHDTSPASGSQLTPMQNALSLCDSGPGKDTLEGGDDGHTIIVSTGPGGSFAGARCVMRALGAGDAVLAQVDSTTALAGAQDADSGGVHYHWTYHPDNGLDMVITDSG